MQQPIGCHQIDGNKQPSDRYVVPPTRQLLIDGGDTRIQLDPLSGTNKYGCKPYPNEQIQLSSSTASAISTQGFAEADTLRQQLAHSLDSQPANEIYRNELERTRCELKQLCGLNESDIDIAFAASGTDLHLIAGQLVADIDTLPTKVIMVGAEETGSGVPLALAGCHFNEQTAQGKPIAKGNRVPDAYSNEIINVAIRQPDGNPRPLSIIDAEIESLVKDAVRTEQRVLLTLVDVSKTGLIAPSPVCAFYLKQKYAEKVDVLVDACQFRLSTSSLRTYLQQGCMVAITGSKFLGGPAFSGALLLPSQITANSHKQIPKGLQSYSVQAEWPSHWNATDLPDLTNFGLLLRWQAALTELKAFQQIPECDISKFLQTFLNAVEKKIHNDPRFELLPISYPDRSALMEKKHWDAIPTIFSFIPYHSKPQGGKTPYHSEETLALYHKLMHDPEYQFRIGQPVSCGMREGRDINALRIAVSAPLVVEACSYPDADRQRFIEKLTSILN